MTVPPSHLAQEAIAALVDGELSGTAAGRAARHLTACLTCRMAVQAQREAKTALQAGAEVVVPGDLLSRLQAIPFTAEISAFPTGSSAEPQLRADELGWSFPVATPAAGPVPARRGRRAVPGAVAGIGLGLAALAVLLPAGDPANSPSTSGGSVDGRAAAAGTASTSPPVVHTVPVGSASDVSEDGTP